MRECKNEKERVGKENNEYKKMIDEGMKGKERGIEE